MFRLSIAAAAMMTFATVAHAEGLAAGPSSQANGAAAGKTVGVEKVLPAGRTSKELSEQHAPLPDGKASSELGEKSAPAEPKN